MRRIAAGIGFFLMASAHVAAAQSCPGMSPWGFDDVDASDPFCTFVTYMATSGVTTGCQVIDANRRLFCPGDFVTRKQMAAFMSRLANGAVFAEGGNAFGSAAVLGTNDAQPLELRVGGKRAMMLVPGTFGINIVAGHWNNSVSPTLSGQAVLGGGGDGTTCQTLTAGPRSCANEVFSNWSTIAGGAANRVTGSNAFIGSGILNTADGDFTAIGSGSGNRTGGMGSTVPGGYYNAAVGDFSFAAGYRAKATTTGSFIWADHSNFDFQPSVSNFFGVRATGGVGFTVAINPSNGAVTQFCNYLPGYSGWSCTSDRNAKENLVAADGRDVLAHLTAMPVYTYNFKGADPSLRMIGPTAQDFHAAFGFGEETTTIASGNLHGVALAAIQGLDAKLAERERALRAELRAKDAELDALRARVAELARAVETLTALVAPPPVAAR